MILSDWLTAAEARCERASKGPWHHLLPEIPYLVYGKQPTLPPIIESIKRPQPSKNDMAFVAAARSDLPRTLRIVRAALDFVAVMRCRCRHTCKITALSPCPACALAAFDAAVKDNGGGANDGL